MKREIDIHSYDVKLEAGMHKVRKSSISKKNKELIEKYKFFTISFKVILSHIAILFMII